MKGIFAAAMNIGLGSGKAFDLGKFNIVKLEIDGESKKKTKGAAE